MNNDTITRATKDTILSALRAWIAQRPGLEFGNYGDVSSYRAELRGITRDRHDAETLLRAVELARGLTADDLRAAFPRAYSGRLSWSEDGKGGGKLDYCCGQYWPTEYRKAVCAVLSSALWDYYRGDFKDTERPGDALRAKFRRLFGRSLASRWFN